MAGFGAPSTGRFCAPHDTIHDPMLSTPSEKDVARLAQSSFRTYRQNPLFRRFQHNQRCVPLTQVLPTRCLFSTAEFLMESTTCRVISTFSSKILRIASWALNSFA